MLRPNLRRVAVMSGTEGVDGNSSGADLKASPPAGVFFNHLGQTITDIARSRRFCHFQSGRRACNVVVRSCAMSGHFGLQDC